MQLLPLQRIHHIPRALRTLRIKQQCPQVVVAADAWRVLANRQRLAIQRFNTNCLTDGSMAGSTFATSIAFAKVGTADGTSKMNVNCGHCVWTYKSPLGSIASV